MRPLLLPLLCILCAGCVHKPPVRTLPPLPSTAVPKPKGAIVRITEGAKSLEAVRLNFNNYGRMVTVWQTYDLSNWTVYTNTTESAVIVPISASAAFFTASVTNGLVSLAWDPVAEVSGYRVYWGTASRSYTNSIFSGRTNAVVGPLVPQTMYYFAATSVAGDLESEYSNEVAYVTPTATSLRVQITPL